MATLLDWGNVDSACLQLEKNLSLSGRRESFTFLCLCTILRIDSDEARGCITEGANDRGIDAVYLDERFGRRVIHLFQMKHHGSFAKSSSNFPSSEIDKILSFLNDCMEQVSGFLDTCNPLLCRKVIDIWDFIQRGSCEVEVHLCSNGTALLPEHRDRFISSLAKFRFIKLNEVDIESISNDLSRTNKSDREIQIRIVEDQVFERTDGSVRAVIGTVRADELIESLLDKKNIHQLDPYLFEENVRIYLGDQNDINRRIFDTASSDESSLFWYYNNGITIVCERFAYQPGFKNAPLKLKNPQIVNGGQTSHALFEASKASFAAIQRVKILVRIIETQDKSFYAKVAEATNSQTPIRSRDLRSNDPVLLRLEASLKGHGWYLDRKRNQHGGIPEKNRIDALKLGQIWLAYVRGEPDKAKTASDRIFGEYFSIIFDPNELDATRAISIWSLYINLETYRREQISAAQRLTQERTSQFAESSWMVEGIYHLAYSVRRIADQKNIDIFDIKNTALLIEEAKQGIDEFVRENPRVSFYRLFRSAATKRSLFFQPPDGFQLLLDL